uniref:Phorbol-ester/DAG-type domain-containing protein n=1 Tax=Brassica oleracea var. oleracea TaxID=109376 RepID=A0A0D3A7S7_BRAOL
MEILKKVYALYPTRGLKCDGCSLGENYYGDGYRCFRSGIFFHKECANSSLEICNLYHPQHSLKIKVCAKNNNVQQECKLCRINLPKMYYYCSICDFAIDLICVKKEVKKEIGDSKIHEHLLSLVPEMVSFTCHLCQVLDDRFPFVCNLCDLSFHQDCAESISEINYSCHPQHPLKRFTRVPNRTGENCCLCGNKLHNVFYHCSVCNFSVDINCVKNPPPFSLLQPKAHEHPIILMPQRSFVCNACGMDDDPNPYVCPQCNFMIHRNCVDKPQVIKINHHDHRIYYNHYLDSDDWECGVCQKEIKWTCGAYSCPKCQDFAVHLRCATKFGIWDGIELEGISETNIELKSYEVVEEGLIKHSSHQNHVLKLNEESDADVEAIVCEACVYPVFCGPFYSCTECDNYILHQKCAHLPKKKIDSFYKMDITLFPCDKMETILGLCEVCQHFFQGFRYITKDDITLDMRCGSISEPFFHESHPHHPLYIDFTGNKTCKACGDEATFILSCQECGYFLDIKCPFLPNKVKHKYDKNHFLFLCYGKNPSDQYLCEICEEELNSEKWFYRCDECCITFHIKCTLGDLISLKQIVDAEPIKLEVIRNIHMTSSSNKP